MKSRNLRRQEAAAYLREQHNIRTSAATLAKYAVVGGGPAFRKDGRFPLYSEEDLEAWAQKRLSKRVFSTSELQA
jgi:hypothetical protein